MSKIVDFFDKLKNVGDVKGYDFKTTCESEITYIRDYYRTLESKKWAFSQYRNYFTNYYYKETPLLCDALKSIYLNNRNIPYTDISDKTYFVAATKYNLSFIELKKHYLFYCKILNYLRIEKAESKLIKNKYTAKVRSNRKQLRYILDVEGYIEKAIEFLNESNFACNILGLSALTGRRVAEIGCTAEFEYVNAFTVNFKGQLKTKKISNKTFDIPVLADSKLIISTLERIRENFPQYINEPTKFHNNCSSALTSKISYFKPFIEGYLTPKDLRAIYAPIAYHKYCPDRVDDSIYYSNILGHNEGDNEDNTYLSYTKFKIKT